MATHHQDLIPDFATLSNLLQYLPKHILYFPMFLLYVKTLLQPH